MYFTEILLWLFVINLGIVSGAGLYEARIVVPLWARAPPESLRSPDSGRKFWAFVSTIPLTLLSLANLLVA
jgi:H+/Cl- antiporter ClcA